LSSAQAEAIPAAATLNTQVPEVEKGGTLEDKELQQGAHETLVNSENIKHGLLCNTLS